MKALQIHQTFFLIREVIKMKGIAFACVLAGPILVNSDVTNATTNVVSDKLLVLNGDYGVLVNNCCGWDPSEPVAPATTLVDGEFLPVSHTWQDNTVWWDAANPGSANNSIEIDLMLDHFIEGFVVQVDDNDAYRIEYLDEANSWVSAWEIPIVGGYGMQTRPNTFDNTEVFALPTAIKTNRLRFTAVSGDGFYSVSEIQALGSVVPEPSTGAMCAIALILLVGKKMFQMISCTVVGEKQRIQSRPA